MKERTAADSGARAPIRVARIITRMNIGGPAIHVTLLQRDLRQRGYCTALLTGNCEAEEGSMEYLLDGAGPVYRVPQLSRSVSPLKNLRALFEVWRILRRERPDVVHTHTAMAGCVGRAAAILAGAPVIVHTFHGNSLRHYFSRPAAVMFLAIERLLARRTAAICVLSEQQLEELCGELRVAPRERFHVVPLGLDLAPFLSAPPPRAATPLRVAWFGRMVAVKNIALLLEIAEALRDDDRFEFHVTGDGADRGLVEAAAPRLGRRLKWHGWQQDIAPILAGCDLVIQTSRNEGTPVALIQGMAAGRPFLSTAAGGVVDMTAGAPRELTPGSKWFDNAVLAEASSCAFAAALDGFARAPDRIAAMGQAARAFAADRYSKTALVSNLDALYRELLARPHTQGARPGLISQNNFKDAHP